MKILNKLCRKTMSLRKFCEHKYSNTCIRIWPLGNIFLGTSLNIPQNNTHGHNQHSYSLNVQNQTIQKLLNTPSIPIYRHVGLSRGRAKQIQGGALAFHSFLPYGCVYGEN